MSNDAVIAVVRALRESGIDYMLVGSYSSNYYGIARATRDADFVVQADPATVLAALRGLGSPFILEPQLSFETVTCTTRHILQLENTSFKVEVFYVSDDEHDRMRFARRVEIESLGTTLYLPTPEDVIITKLRWNEQGARKKDLEDARVVISVQGDSLDWNYIESWCAKHATTQILHELRPRLS
ncbi:MAG: DUF6036 family nucleotidyltransferase [Phycisphaerae bacterium]